MFITRCLYKLVFFYNWKICLCNWLQVIRNIGEGESHCGQSYVWALYLWWERWMHLQSLIYNKNQNFYFWFFTFICLLITADVEEIQKISKSNPFKLPIFNNSRKERKKNCPTLETLNQAKTKESPLTKSRFTKTKKGKKLYENAEELAATACDQNKGNTESKNTNDIKSRNIKETKSKPLVLPKPKKQLSKASKAFSYF